MPSIISINREEILELTRRMTLSRASMTRIAGSYMDSEGFIDGNVDVLCSANCCIFVINSFSVKQR